MKKPVWIGAGLMASPKRDQFDFANFMAGDPSPNRPWQRSVPDNEFVIIEAKAGCAHSKCRGDTDSNN